MRGSGEHRQSPREPASKEGPAGAAAVKGGLAWCSKDSRVLTVACALFRVARPHHYIKNVFVWLPLFFGHKANNADAVAGTLLAFLSFCLAASAVYVLNDILDVDEDRRHLRKKSRPLARGAIRVSAAVCFMVTLASLSLFIAGTWLPRSLAAVMGGYLLLNVGYSFYLKQFAIVDLVCIAVGFVLRVVAGGLAADVAVSHWLVIMTFLLATFLALGKRRDDLLQAAAGNGARKSLDGYNLDFVSVSMVALASVIIVSYLLYSVSPEVAGKHGTSNLYISSFWVIVGFLRYLQVTFVHKRSGSPTQIFLEDAFLKCVVIGWFLTVYVLIYGPGF